jgi:hypothetical protein
MTELFTKPDKLPSAPCLFCLHETTHLYTESGTEERAKITNTLVHLEPEKILSNLHVRPEEPIPLPAEFFTKEVRQKDKDDTARGDHANHDAGKDVERERKQSFVGIDIGEAIGEIAPEDLAQLIDLSY